MEAIQRWLFAGAVLAVMAAFGIMKTNDEDSGKFGIGCIILAIVLAALGFGYSKEDPTDDSTYETTEQNISNGENIHFKGDIDTYKYEYKLKAYNGSGYYVCDVIIKSKDGYLYAFPNDTSYPVEVWEAPYNSPNGCQYSCRWGGGFIYF